MTDMPIRAAGHAMVTLLALIGLIGMAALMTATLATASPARAATAYRYWAYYLGHGSSWQYSTRGPATEYPADGDVQGWRFGAQGDADGGLQPGAPPTFTTLCASTPVKAGDIRVGLVLDFGSAADAPAHEHPPASVVPGCVSVPAQSTGADVLQAAATVRIGTGTYAGLVCGIDGYPATECAIAVTAPAPKASPTPTPTPTRASTLTPTRAAAPTSAASSTATSPAAPTGSAVPSVAALAASTTAPTREPSTSASAVSSPPVRSAFVALRTTDHHRFPVLTVVGGALVVAIGGGAVWRARAGRR